MELKKFFLEQLETEAAASRKAIERVPEGQNQWRPHERSMELGYLASLVALTADDKSSVKAAGVFFPPTDFLNYRGMKIAAEEEG